MGADWLDWHPRVEPLAPLAVAARGEVARKLARKLALRAHELTGVKAGEWLVVLGDDLPWVDGVVYLGKESPLDAVLTPTHLAPSWPTDWIARTLGKRSSPPWAVLPEVIVGLSRASRIEPELLP